MQVLLDSSFIISCVRDRIDFISQLEEQGFTPVVPREVLQEGKFIATLDKGIKKRVPKKIVIFRAQNRVGVEEGA